MNCNFVGCGGEAYDGNAYCLPHLQNLTRENVRRAVFEIVRDELGVDANEVTPNARLVDDLGADSLDSVELIMRFERLFGLDIPPEEVEKIQSVRDAVERLTSLLLSGP